jgi:hypothetical protein
LPQSDDREDCRQNNRRTTITATAANPSRCDLEIISAAKEALLGAGKQLPDQIRLATLRHFAASHKPEI